MAQCEIVIESLSVAADALGAVPYITGGWAYVYCNEVYVVPKTQMMALGLNILNEEFDTPVHKIIENWAWNHSDDELAGPFPITL